MQSYETFVAKLNERIPDALLVDQLEKELSVGGDAPDLKQMAIRQKARQDIEAHKGYKPANNQNERPQRRLVIRVIKFADMALTDGQDSGKAGNADEAEGL